MVEKTAVDELLRDDFLISVGFRKIVPVANWELELVLTKAGDFSEVVVAGIGAGKSQAVVSLKREIKFSRKFEVDESIGFEIPEEEINFSNGGMAVFLNLEAFFFEFELRGTFENG